MEVKRGKCRKLMLLWNFDVFYTFPHPAEFKLRAHKKYLKTAPDFQKLNFITHWRNLCIRLYRFY